MHKELELFKFNLTPNMSLELIKFNKLKKELLDYKKLYDLDKNKELLLKIQKLEKELNEVRINFIKDFRINNKDEIIKYLENKDQF